MMKRTKPRSKVWKFYREVTDRGKTMASCLYCETTYANNATRMSRHIMTCKKCPQDVQHKWITSCNMASKAGVTTCSTNDSDSDSKTNEHSRESSATRPTPVVQASTSSQIGDAADADTVQGHGGSTSTSHGCDTPGPSLSQASSVKPQSTKVTKLTTANLSLFVDKISQAEKEKIDREIARAIYASGCPLSLTENEHWVKALRSLRPAYDPPSRYLLSNRLLEDEFNAVRKTVKGTIANAPCLSLLSDGWTNVRGDGIINFMICTPKPIFYKSIATDANRHTAEYISEKMISVLREVGAENFLAIVSDNAANMKASWKIIQKTFPHIYCYGCIAHGLNLLIGDVCKLPSLLTILDNVKEIVLYVRRHQVVNATVTKNQQKQKGTTTRLQLPVVTRWGSNVHCLKSLVNTKAALQTTFIDDVLAPDIPRAIRKRVLDNDVFWVQVEKSLKLLKPFADAITVLESDKPRLSHIPGIFSSLRQHMTTMLKSSPLSKKDELGMVSAFDSRETFCKNPLQMAARLLDPSQHGPTFDEEDLQEAYACVIEVAQKLQSSTTDITESVLSEIARYKAHEGKLWGSQLVWKAAKCTDPVVWWKGMCANSSLSAVAIQILSLPASAASCERNWSAFGNIHTAKRNRLTNDRASKLVYVYHNLQLLKTETADSCTGSKRKVLSSSDDESDYDGSDMQLESQSQSQIPSTHTDIPCCSNDSFGMNRMMPNLSMECGFNTEFSGLPELRGELVSNRPIDNDDDNESNSSTHSHSRWSGL
jgi:Protein of unknown function (DUF 659)/hAT family C-terminal dimerisation region/BED zinc finger